MLSGVIEGGAPLGCLIFTGQWVRDALMLSAIASADRSQGRQGASNTSLCFFVTNIPICWSFSILGSARTIKWLGRTQCPLQRQHPSRTWAFPTFPTPPDRGGAPWLLGRPCSCHGLGLPAHPWLPAGRAGSHGCHRGSPWTPLPAQPSARLGCWGDGLVYLPSGLR